MSTAVLIVNYHAYADLDRCLQSLGPALGPDDEVVVVDNESEPAAAARLHDRHPRVRVLVEDRNRGFAAAVNRGAAAARSPHLLLLNPDTMVEPALLGDLRAWFAAHPDVGVAGPRVLNADGSVQPSARRFPGLSTLFGGRATWLTRHFPNNPLSRRNLLARDGAGPVDVDWVSGACLMTRRSLFDRLGGFDERFFMYWEDADYCRRVREAGWRCTYVPDVRVRHDVGTSAQRDPAAAIRAFHRSAYCLFRKYAGPVGLIAAPLVRLGLFLRGELRARRAVRAARLFPRPSIGGQASSS